MRDGYWVTKLKLIMSNDTNQEPNDSPSTSHVHYTTLPAPSVEMPQNRSPDPNVEMPQNRSSPNLFYASTSYDEASCSR